MTNQNCDKALEFWIVGMQYLQLVKNIIRETITQKNKHVIVSEATDWPAEDFWDQYGDDTRWSDHSIIIPTLFILLHGFELMLKGYIIAEGGEPGPKHKLSDLLNSFKVNHSSKNLCCIFSKYIEQGKLPPLLLEFCKESNITMDEYYQALKYPESTKGDQYKHYSLKYKDEAGLPFFRSLLEDLTALSKEAVALSKAICPNIYVNPCGSLRDPPDHAPNGAIIACWVPC